MIPLTSKISKSLAATMVVLGLLCSVEKSFAQSDWKKEWQKTLAAAKKEGEVVIYIYRYERLLQDFNREYPWIKIVSVAGRGTELTTRVMSERRAGKYIVDVYSGGTNGNYNVLYKGKVLDPIKPMLILPEVVDQTKWYGNEHRYADAEGKYIFAYLANPSGSQLSYKYNHGEREGVQVLLGGHKSKMERKDRELGSSGYRPGGDDAVFLF